MDEAEFKILRKAAWMDASGQANVMMDPDHGGRPYVFAGIGGDGADGEKGQGMIIP